MNVDIYKSKGFKVEFILKQEVNNPWKSLWKTEKFKLKNTIFIRYCRLLQIAIINLFKGGLNNV